MARKSVSTRRPKQKKRVTRVNGRRKSSWTIKSRTKWTRYGKIWVFPMAELKVSFEKKKNCLIIRLNGAFEGMDVMRVQDEIYGMLDSLEASSVVLDFAGVDYIDSAGIGT